MCFLGKQRGQHGSTFYPNRFFSSLSRTNVSFSLSMYFNLVVSVQTKHFIISLNSSGCERQGQKESVREGRGRIKLVTSSSRFFVHFSFVTCCHIFFLGNSDHWVINQTRPSYKVVFTEPYPLFPVETEENQMTWVVQAVACHVKWPPFMSLMHFPSSLHPLTVIIAVVAFQCQLLLFILITLRPWHIGTLPASFPCSLWIAPSTCWNRLLLLRKEVFYVIILPLFCNSVEKSPVYLLFSRIF